MRADRLLEKSNLDDLRNNSVDSHLTVKCNLRRDNDKKSYLTYVSIANSIVWQLLVFLNQLF